MPPRRTSTAKTLPEPDLAKNRMATTGQEIYQEMGREHWWLSGKYEILKRVFTEYGPRRGVVLDVGCGPGNLMVEIQPLTRARMLGADLSFLGLGLARQAGLDNLVLTDMAAAAIKSEACDFILAVDILEHVPDDKQLLRELLRVLKPGGRLLAVVPAHPILWGEHDDLFGHYRRYYRQELRSRMESSGFRILKISYMQSLFFLPLLLFRSIKNATRCHSQDFFAFPERLNRLLHRLVASEYGLLRRLSLPIGTNILCVVEKPGTQL
jgi:SAM-dependent methyltransferase